jgi:hypothetical protein
MRRTLPREVLSDRTNVIKAWVLSITLNLIAILLLAVFAAVVYDRIAIDLFSPPVYSIWVRPGETRHHAEFVISPSYGFGMVIDGNSIFNYRFERRQQNDRWNSEDRPRLVASYLEIPRGLDKYYWTFVNYGKEDATNIMINIATVDLNKTHRTMLTTALTVLPRLKQGIVSPVITALENNLQFLIVCMTYSNDRGTAFVDPPQFYLTPFYMKASRETRSEPARVTALQYDQLSAGFSCANL